MSPTRSPKTPAPIDERDRGEGRGAAAGQRAGTEPDRRRHDRGEDDARVGEDRGGENRPDRPCGDRHLRQTAVFGERDPGEPDCEGGGREDGEIVDPEERHLALAGSLSFELVDEAEELEEPPRARDGAPPDEDDQEAVDVDTSTEQQDERRGEQRILDELRRADQVLLRVVERRPETGHDDQRQQGPCDRPERARPPQRSEPPRGFPPTSAAATVAAIAMSEPKMSSGPSDVCAW